MKVVVNRNEILVCLNGAQEISEEYSVWGQLKSIHVCKFVSLHLEGQQKVGFHEKQWLNTERFGCNL